MFFLNFKQAYFKLLNKCKQLNLNVQQKNLKVNACMLEHYNNTMSPIII